MHIVEAIEARDGALAQRLVEDHALALATHVADNARISDNLKSNGGTCFNGRLRKDLTMSDTATDTLRKRSLRRCRIWWPSGCKS